MRDELRQALEIFKKGGIVIFPTDTAFGIGCRIDDDQAIERLFRAKKRSVSKAMPVLVESVDMAQKYLVNIPNKVREELIDKYWPGALTIVLPCRLEKVPEKARGGKDNLGVRMPNSKELLILIRELGVPILGSSANFGGESTPYTIDDLNPELVGQVDFVLNGICGLKQASTVIDCTKQDWKILRLGACQI